MISLARMGEGGEKSMGLLSLRILDINLELSQFDMRTCKRLTFDSGTNHL